MKFFSALIAGCWCVQSSGAIAQTGWSVDKDQSAVSFEYVENGKTKSGTFNTFDAHIQFDFGMPEKSFANITVDTMSIDLGDAMREGVLSSLPWFNSSEFPEAEFRMAGLAEVDDDKYIADGFLKIKAVKLPVKVEIDVLFEGESAQAKGTLIINRRDFRLRDALLESIVSIDETVSIGFDLIAETEKE